MYQKIINEVKSYADNNYAKWLNPLLSIDSNSEDILIGVRVPILRKLAKKYKDIDLTTIKKLLNYKVHEIRALAIFIMLLRVKKEPEIISNLYLNNLKYINNWDLIDYSAPHIIAPNVEKGILKKLAKSTYLWANRVAIVSTIYYIKKGDFDLTLDMAKDFIYHEHHLIHKATGWMLREIGKKDEQVLKSFLNQYSSKMPAIMRNYATEKIKFTSKKL